LIHRAQERLPGETVLLQLKAEAETRQQELAAKKLIEKTSLHVYSLLLTSPQEALVVVQQALAQLPGDPQLTALHEKIVGQIKKASAEELKTQSLKRAQAAIDDKQFDQAIQILEAAALECGEVPDIASLLKYAREQKRRIDLSQKAASAVREAQPLIAAGQFETAIALLQPVASETGDVAVEQLLRQATGALAELNRRIDAALSRAQTLSQSNIEEALRLLASQPQDIQQNARVRELRAKLEAGKEQERVTLEAIRAAGDALQNRDLRNGLSGLESVRRTYGDSPRVSSAIADYKTRRTQIANEAVTAAIASATQAMQQEDRPRAAQELAGVASVAEFADSGLQTNLKRLTKEAGKAAPKKQVKAAADPAGAKSGFPRALIFVFVGIAIVLFAAAGAAYWYLRPAPAVPMGALELNATPYAEVVSVTSDKGTAVPLPAGDHWTPLRLDGVPLGKYTVSLKGADGSTQNLQCEVAQTAQVCSVEMKPIDDNAIQEIIGGAK